MNVIVTGHTRGIGQAIAEWFTERGHTILGFSRTTGHDLGLAEARQSLFDATHQVADVFVNNAYGVAPVELLYMFYDAWKADPGKTIITISSMAADGTKDFQHPYAVYKSALDKAVEQLQNTSHQCRVLNVRPNYVDTTLVAHVIANKLPPKHVAEVVGWMFEQPTLIKSLTVASRDVGTWIPP